MEKRLPRRAVLAAVAAGSGAALLGAPGGGMAARPSGGREPRASVTEISQEGTPVIAQTNKELWGPWLELWNGDLAVADEIIAPGFVAHFAPAPGSPEEVRGPEGLATWIGGILSAFTDASFATAVGPLADGDLIAGRWIFRGTYQGGMAGSSPDAIGRQVEYAGVDILRVEDGKLVEYWLSADILDLLVQIGTIPS